MASTDDHVTLRHYVDDEGKESTETVEYLIEPFADDDEAGPDELIDVRCVICGDEVQVIFVHEQTEGRRVAIARRSGLCTTCVALIKGGESESAADRGSAQWDDFERVDLIQTIQDIAASIKPYRPSLGLSSSPPE